MAHIDISDSCIVSDITANTRLCWTYRPVPKTNDTRSVNGGSLCRKLSLRACVQLSQDNKLRTSTDNAASESYFQVSSVLSKDNTLPPANILVLHRDDRIHD